MSIDIRSIVQQVQEGDRHAFTEIIREYQARLRMLMRVLLWDGSSVDDITQEVFVTAYLRIDTYDSARGEFYSWLKGIARNMASNENRRMQKRRYSRANYLADIRMEEGFQDELATQGWLDEAMDRLQTCLDRLPAKVKGLFSNIYRDEMRIKDIAQAQAMSDTSVRVTVHRGRVLLKSCLESGGVLV